MAEADRAPIIHLPVDQEVFIDTVRDGDTVEDATVATEVTSFDRVGDAYVLEGAIVFAGYLARESHTGGREVQSPHALTLDFDETDYAEHVHHRMPFVLRVPVTAQSRGIVNVASRISAWKLDVISAGWMRVVADLSVIGLNGNMGYHFQCGAQEAGNLFFEQDWLDDPHTADASFSAVPDFGAQAAETAVPAVPGAGEEAQPSVEMRGDADVDDAQEAAQTRGAAEADDAQEAAQTRGAAEADDAQETAQTRGAAEADAQQAAEMRGNTDETRLDGETFGEERAEASAESPTEPQTAEVAERSDGSVNTTERRTEDATESGTDSTLQAATDDTPQASGAEQEEYASMMRGVKEEDSSDTADVTSGYGDKSALYEAMQSVSEARGGHGLQAGTGSEPDVKAAADELLRLDRALDGAHTRQEGPADPPHQTAEEVKPPQAVVEAAQVSADPQEQTNEPAVFEFEHQVTSAELQASPENDDQEFAASRSFGDDGFRPASGFFPTVRVGSKLSGEQTETTDTELRSEAAGGQSQAIETVKVDQDLWSFVDFNAPETYFTLRYAIVADEESLDMVAERVGCSKSDLVRANHLASDTVPPGFPLRVPNGRSAVNN